MINPNLIEISDGDGDLIIFSQTFNIFGNSLSIKNIIEDWVIKFNFVDENNVPGTVTVTGNDENKEISIELKNFSNNLGVSSQNKLPFWQSLDGKTLLLLSVFAQRISNDSEPNKSYRKLLVTIYSQKK